MKATFPTALLIFLLVPSLVAGQAPDSLFTLERTVAHSGFDGTMCWVHARGGAIPPGQPGNDSPHPLIVMTLQKLLLSGSDVFYALNEMRSSDLGKSWTEPQPHPSFERQVFSAASPELPTGATRAPHLLQEGDETTVCDFTPKWHAASQSLLGTGHTVWYRDNHVLHGAPRGLAYAVYDAVSNQWTPWATVDLPREAKFQRAGAGSVQRVDLPDGDLLIPIYFNDPRQKDYSVTVCRCRFDGHTLKYVEHGTELTVPLNRGLGEPSLAQYGGKFYLTMRNNEHGYVSVSDDGLTFAPPRRWTFDDGSDLGNYNTQQHWVTHRDGLHLVYTRRGADNDHVFRHRAPLFIARVDVDNLCVIRQTEQVLIPERGARLGNFGVVEVSAEETWVTAAEWMQPSGVEQHGSDNSIFVVKLKWNQPNHSAPPVDAGN
ncbi:MAG: exo-alpha-sialidase [Planctomycetales bacterium]|nr:exo-alpha-sialidase [Planctomycetales bacterium]